MILRLFFFNLLAVEKDKKNLETEISLYLQRIKELKDRVRIGRSRSSEVLTVDSTLATLQAQIETTKSQISSYREALNFQTGLSRDLSLIDTIQTPPNIDSIDTYLKAIEERPDILSAKEILTASQEGISIAKGVRFPGVSLLGDYYFLRYGSQQNVMWDVGAQLTIPLFTGGTIDSQVRVAASQDYQAELNLRRLREAAETEIRTDYQGFISDRAQIQALIHARDLSKSNYEVQTRDYRHGLVANIDVVTALTSYEESVRALDHATFTEKLDYVRLQNASGKFN